MRAPTKQLAQIKTEKNQAGIATPPQRMRHKHSYQDLGKGVSCSADCFENN
jgi:hypothetical protein